MAVCPVCSNSTHRSRLRSRWETWRRALTGRRPYRCHVCNWRGWQEDVEPYENPSTWSYPAPSEVLNAGPRTELDLDLLDSSLREAKLRASNPGDRTRID